MTQTIVSQIEAWLTQNGYGPLADRATIPGTNAVRTLINETRCAKQTRYYGIRTGYESSRISADIAGAVANANRYLLVADGSRVDETDPLFDKVLSIQPIVNQDSDRLSHLGAEVLLIGDSVLVARPWHSAEPWYVSALAEDIGPARDVFMSLSAQIDQDIGRRSPLSPSAAPLIDMASFAIAEASTLCAEDGSGRRLCDWYHGLWPYLRLFGMAATPERHADFFHSAFTETAKTGDFDRILVCGTADYAMPFMAHHVYDRNGRTPDLTVMDICPTPLALCKRFSQYARVKWNYRVHDALEPEDGEPYDLICSHSFLSRFDARTRPVLMARWFESLRPGGRVVTTTRINPQWMPDQARMTPEQVDTFVDQVAERARRWQRILPLNTDAVVTMARKYATCQKSYSVRSEDELVDLTTGAGLHIVRLDLKDVPGGKTSGTGAPGLVKSAQYAGVVAERPKH